MNMNSKERKSIAIPDGTTTLAKEWTGEANNIKRIYIPQSVQFFSPQLDFLELYNCVVEIPETLWDSTDILENYVIKPEARSDYCKYAEIIFKIIRFDGTYYFSYLNYQACYGEYCEYCQIGGDLDDDIDDQLIRHYDTDKNIHYKTLARVCRLATPYQLSDENKVRFIKYVKKYAMKAVEEIASYDCPDLLRCLFAYNMIKEESVDDVKEILKRANAEDCLMQFDQIRTVERMTAPKVKIQR